MICAKTKQWGNSIGIIIPKNVVNELGIKPNEEICIDVNKKKGNVLRELYGALKFNKPTEQLLREARRDLESRYD